MNLGAGTGDVEKTRGDETVPLSHPMFSLFAAEAVKFRVGVGSFPEPAVPGVAGLSVCAATPEVLGGTNFATLSGVHAKPLQDLLLSAQRALRSCCA